MFQSYGRADDCDTINHRNFLRPPQNPNFNAITVAMIMQYFFVGLFEANLSFNWLLERYSMSHHLDPYPNSHQLRSE